MKSYIKRLQHKWNKFGEEDPFWCILSNDNKKNGKWDVDEFFKTGERDVKEIFKYIDSFNIKINNQRALDFGCGVGRLTQELANYFLEVRGVDISKSLLELAHNYNQQKKRVFYHLNERPDLKLFPDNFFDFIYTKITLQHMSPKNSKRYIIEFLRTLKPGGALIFELPAPFRITSLKQLNLDNLFILGAQYSPRWLLDLVLPSPYFDMYGTKKKKIIKLLKNKGAKIIDIKDDYSAGGQWKGYQYFIVK